MYKRIEYVFGCCPARLLAFRRPAVGQRQTNAACRPRVTLSTPSTTWGTPSSWSHSLSVWFPWMYWSAKHAVGARWAETRSVARPPSPAQGHLLGPDSNMLTKSTGTFVEIYCTNYVWLNMLLWNDYRCPSISRTTISQTLDTPDDVRATDLPYCLKEPSLTRILDKPDGFLATKASDLSRDTCSCQAWMLGYFDPVKIWFCIIK